MMDTEMKIRLTEANFDDKVNVWNMIQEIGPGENGFRNGGYNIPLKEIDDYIKKLIDVSNGVGIKQEYVPQTVYWLYIDDKVVGISKLRHYLNDKLRKKGGNIGFCIRPSERRKGYGTILLSETLKKAETMGISKALITCDETNTASRKIIEKNSGKLEKVQDGNCYSWIQL